MSENNGAAAELFLLLAVFWHPPDEEFMDELNCGSLDADIARLGSQADYIPWWEACMTFRFMAPSLGSLQKFHNDHINGTGKASILPVESLYKRWTEDPTARLPIAGSTGYLMGDAAMHVQYLLDFYGLSVPPAYRMMPDHLVLLLELTAFLLKNQALNESHLFISQHLDWLDSLAHSLAELSCDDMAGQQAQKFYQFALQALQKTVACELAKANQ